MSQEEETNDLTMEDNFGEFASDKEEETVVAPPKKQAKAPAKKSKSAPKKQNSKPAPKKTMKKLEEYASEEEGEEEEQDEVKSYFIEGEAEQGESEEEEGEEGFVEQKEEKPKYIIQESTKTTRTQIKEDPKPVSKAKAMLKPIAKPAPVKPKENGEHQAKRQKVSQEKHVKVDNHDEDQELEVENGDEKPATKKRKQKKNGDESEEIPKNKKGKELNIAIHGYCKTIADAIRSGETDKEKINYPRNLSPEEERIFYKFFQILIHYVANIPKIKDLVADPFAKFKTQPELKEHLQSEPGLFLLFYKFLAKTTEGIYDHHEKEPVTMLWKKVDKI